MPPHHQCWKIIPLMQCGSRSRNEQAPFQTPCTSSNAAQKLRLTLKESVAAPQTADWVSYTQANMAVRGRHCVQLREYIHIYIYIYVEAYCGLVLLPPPTNSPLSSCYRPPRRLLLFDIKERKELVLLTSWWKCCQDRYITHSLGLVGWLVVQFSAKFPSLCGG